MPKGSALRNAERTRHHAPRAQPSLDATAAPAGRFARRSWLNGRLAFGVLLVVIAVLGGALLLRRADTTVGVLAAQRDLPSGLALQAGDVRAVRVRLPAEQLGAYVRADRAVRGGHLTAGLPKGALLPAALLVPAGRRTDLVEYSIPVDPVDVPDVRPGDRVAVAVSFDEGVRRGRGGILLPSVEVVRVLRATAGLDGDNRVEAVQVRLPKDRVAAVAGAVSGGRISVAKLASGDETGVAGAPPDAGEEPASGAAGSQPSSTRRSGAAGTPSSTPGDAP